jgi:TolB-like protein
LLAIGAVSLWLRPGSINITSIEVQPFTAANDDPVAPGITEEIIDDLSHVRGLRVGTGAQATMDGTFERTNSRVRLVLRVKRTDGTRLWERTIDRPLAELSSIPADAAGFISGEARKLAPRRKTAPAAYQAYLEGRGWFARQDGDSINKAIACFQKATDADSGFALAWAWNSIAREYPADAGAVHPNDSLPQARDAAERSVQMGSDLAETHAAVGIVRLQYDWEWEDARRELDRALQLNPGSRVARYWRERWSEATSHATPHALTFAHFPPLQNDADARKLLEDADDIRVETYLSPVGLALVANSLHDTERVFHWLDEAYDERSPQLPYVVWDRSLPRDDARFADLMQRMKLPYTE